MVVVPHLVVCCGFHIMDEVGFIVAGNDMAGDSRILLIYVTVAIKIAVV